MAACMRTYERSRGKVIDFNSIGTWRKVDVDPGIWADENFAGFSGLEELTDFDHQKLNAALRGSKKGSKKRETKSTKKRPSEKRALVKTKPGGPAAERAVKKKSGRELYREILERRRERKGLAVKQESETDMSAWSSLPVPNPVLRALAELRFTSPTPIQAQCLGPAIVDKSDIVGGAETGSGKTLAFGIPLLDMILKAKEEVHTGTGQPRSKSMTSSTLSGELRASADGDQSKEENLNLEKSEIDSDGSKLFPDDDDDVDQPPTGPVEVDQPKGLEGLRALILTPTRELAVQVRNHIQAVAKYTGVKIAVVVGGMSVEKQSRILKRKPEIVVGTPGRIWEFYQQGESHLLTLPRIKTLVIDEADRMIEKRHFEELTEILGVLNSSPHKPDRQTMLFSATLALVHVGPTRKLLNWKQRTQQQILGSLMDRIGIKEDAKIVDLTQKEGTVSSLMESKIFCSVDQKDYYLFYFLLQYPGRTLVFCNSIDCVRRLQSVLTILKRSPYPLHSSMHQKQRLKNLDRFTESPNGLLLATDVAARGLDIPNVQHVIHYQVPRTAEIYIHRSGRTARQAKQGLSMLLICSNEIGFYRRVCKTLDKEEIVTFPVDHRYLKEVSARVDLAREIDVLTHRFEKKKVKNDWFEQAAKDLEVDLDERMILENLGDPHEQKLHRFKMQKLRDEMDIMLKKKIFPSGHSQVYITSSGSLLTPMLKDESSQQQDAVTKLQNDKHFRKDRKKVEARRLTRKREAEEMGIPGEQVKKKKRTKNKYHHLGKKGDAKGKQEP